DDADGQGVLRRVPEEVVVEEADVVAQPDPVHVGGRRQFHLVQRGPARVEQREQAEGQEQQEERRDEGIRAPAHVPLPAAGQPGPAALVRGGGRLARGRTGRGRAPLLGGGRGGVVP